MNAVLACVVPDVKSLGFRQNAEKRRIGVGDPGAESESTDENSEPGQQGVEQVESAHGTHAHEEKQRSFYPEVREGLVQALVDSVPAPAIGVCLHGSPSTAGSGRFGPGWRLRSIKFPRARPE